MHQPPLTSTPTIPKPQPSLRTPYQPTPSLLRPPHSTLQQTTQPPHHTIPTSPHHILLQPIHSTNLTTTHITNINRYHLTIHHSQTNLLPRLQIPTLHLPHTPKLRTNTATKPHPTPRTTPNPPQPTPSNTLRLRRRLTSQQHTIQRTLTQQGPHQALDTHRPQAPPNSVAQPNDEPPSNANSPTHTQTANNQPQPQPQPTPTHYNQQDEPHTTTYQKATPHQPSQYADESKESHHT